ncbi:MAG: LysR family transcriptional regulator [Enterobacteriaceae bacterium]|jgi:DNA-binding transcriptional LysR family regulator|nr:LysR family transcriptional regulator [Enterobacteriaceae bacterium]
MRVNLDVLQILDALEKHGSFAAAAESLYKTPSALSYMVQKLESDLDIKLLDRSGHRSKFTDTGKVVLEKGRMLLNAAKNIEKQAVQIESGWEKELHIALDVSFPFHILLPMIEEFYQLNSLTQLQFTHHALAGTWEQLTLNSADIVIGAVNDPPISSEFSYQMLGTLDNVFVISPAHPLAKVEEPIDNRIICQYRTIVISDTVQHSPRQNSNYIKEQEHMRVFDFHNKVQALICGLGCGHLPRHIAEPYLRSGVLLEKQVVSLRKTDVAYIGWSNMAQGEAARWWLENVINSELIKSMYT